jgi:kynurenine formamidase
MYNGFDASEVCYKGALKCGIDVARDGIISRGVLLDIAGTKNVDWLSSRDSISADELGNAEKAHGVRVEEGDVLVVRTGRPKMRKSRPPTGDYRHEGLAGLDASCLSWLHERKIAMLGTDSGADVFPSGWNGALWGSGDNFELPGAIHVGSLVAMGVHLLDACDLEQLSAVCSRLGRFEFMFNMAPLILERGTCSPVSPIALF